MAARRGGPGPASTGLPRSIRIGAAAMDQELVSQLVSEDRETAAKGARSLAAFLSKASFPSKSVQALSEVA